MLLLGLVVLVYWDEWLDLLYWSMGLLVLWLVLGLHVLVRVYWLIVYDWLLWVWLDEGVWYLVWLVRLVLLLVCDCGFLWVFVGLVLLVLLVWDVGGGLCLSLLWVGWVRMGEGE